MNKILLACIVLLGCQDEQNLGNTPHTVFGSAPRWALTFGSTGDDRAIAAAMPSTGDPIAAGDFTGTVDFGAETVTAPQHAGFVTKRAGGDGSELWSATFGAEDSAIAEASDVAVTADDSVIVAGDWSGDMTIEQQVLHSPGLHVAPECFLAKYDAVGHFQWVRQVSGSTACDGAKIAVGQDGRIAMIGRFQGTIAFPNGTFTAGGDPQSFLAMLDPDGQLLWGSVSDASLGVDSVAITGEDDVVIAGDFHDFTVYQGTPMTTNANETQFVARWTVDGQLMWARTFGTSGQSLETWKVGIDNTGAAIVSAGERVDNNIMDNGKPELGELDPTGQPVWTAEATSGSAIPYALTRFDDGTLVTTGGTLGFPIDLGTGTFHAAMFAAAYNHDGALIDVLPLLENKGGNSLPWGVANIPGALVMVGQVDQPADFGTGTLRWAGGYDAFIAMFDPP